jgi:hypothetical protein
MSPLPATTIVTSCSLAGALNSVEGKLAWRTTDGVPDGTARHRWRQLFQEPADIFRSKRLGRLRLPGDRA